jgi:hypothetical protein
VVGTESRFSDPWLLNLFAGGELKQASAMQKLNEIQYYSLLFVCKRDGMVRSRQRKKSRHL